MLESIPEEELGSLRRGLRGLFGVATGIHAGVLVICIVRAVLVAALGYPLEFAHVRADLVDVDEVLPRGLVIGPTAPFATELSIGRRVLGKAPDAWLIVTQDKDAAIAWGVCWGAATALQATVWVVLLEQVSDLEVGCLTGTTWVSPLRTLVLGQCVCVGLLTLVSLTPRAVTEFGWADAHVSLLYGSIAYVQLGKKKNESL